MRVPQILWRKEQTLCQIPIEKIRTNPYQPRRYFQRTSLEELSHSLAQYGLLHPVLVRKMPNGYYELVTGERRLRAAELLGWTELSARIVQMSDCDSALQILTENVQMQPLSYLEEAEGYQNLMQDYDFTEEQIAQKIGKSSTYISELLRILKLDDPIKRLLLENAYTVRYAKALLKLPDNDTRMLVLQQVIHEDLTIQQTERLVAEVSEQLCYHMPIHLTQQKQKQYVTDSRLYVNTVRQAIALIQNAGGKVIYHTKEEDTQYSIEIVLQK